MSTTSQLNIIIGLLVIIIVALGYMIYKSTTKESFKYTCDSCAKLLNDKNDCSMINNPQYSSGPCDGAGEFLGQSPNWVEFCADHNAACTEQSDDSASKA